MIDLQLAGVADQGQIHIAVLIKILDGQTAALGLVQAEFGGDFREGPIAIIGVDLQACRREQNDIHVAVVIKIGEKGLLGFCSGKTRGSADIGELALAVVGEQVNAGTKGQ